MEHYMITSNATTPPVAASIRHGALVGMAAAAAMAMYAMVASLTYQDHGFFTPLFHISALFGSPKSMMQSMTAAMAGDRFWFTAGAAIVGLLIHMMTGAVYGMGFALLVRRVRGGALVVAGTLFGLLALLLSGFIGLPVAASITDAGSTISDMADMVGWGTFAVEHAIFGMVLGAGILALRGGRVAVLSSRRSLRVPA
jgi:hypothetical protein